MLKAVLVDLDGTLVDSAAANAAAYAQALAEWGIAVDAAALAPRIDGHGWRDFLPGLVAGRGVAAADVAQRKRALYPDFFHLLRLNAPLADLLGHLRGRVATGLVTTASSQAVQGIFDHFGLHALFDVTVCGDQVARGKPHPEAYATAASRLGAAAAECLVIEDSEVGVAAARAFGGGLLRWSPPAAE